VTQGLDVVKKIQASPAKGQSLEPPVAILRAYRLPHEASAEPKEKKLQ
jgi:hypothetical protein